MQDPRHRNDRFDGQSLGRYLTGYADKLRDALNSINVAALEAAHQAIVGASNGGKRIYAIGNGGSAAIADHLCCDWTKGTHTHCHPTIDTTSLSANGALYSAIANDFGFENVFSTQVGMFGHSGDVLVAISSSGNSPNILNAVSKAHELGMTTISLTGFDGGKLKSAAQIALHVDARNYGIVEDAHQSLMHVLAQYISFHRDNQQASRN